MTNDLAQRYGYEEAAEKIQDLYLDGKKKEAEALVPTEWLEAGNLVGRGTGSFARSNVPLTPDVHYV